MKIFQGVEIPPQNEIYRDLTSFDTYRFKPEKSPDIPVKLGERSQYLLLLSIIISFQFSPPGCDNSYDGGVPPCLLRPWLPPYSYSTTEVDNGEYRRRRRESRVWRAVFRR